MRKSIRGQALMAVVLGILALLFLYPLIWMLLSSFKTNAEIYRSNSLWPSSWDWRYLREALSSEDLLFWSGLRNSVAVSGLGAVVSTLAAAAAGFALSQASTRALWIWLGLAVFMILLPVHSMALPTFAWINDLGLYDTLLGIVLPFSASGLGLVYFVKVYGRLPNELLQAARIEGASEFRLFCTLLPLTRPHLIAFAFVQGVLIWHAHLLPLLIIGSEENRTLPLALSALYGSSLRAPQAVFLAGSALGLLPLLAAFLFAFPSFKTALRDLSD